MQTKRPMIKETVGAQYYSFNKPTEGVEFDPTKYEETIKTETVKSIKTTENAETTPITASGKTYTTVNQTSDVEIEVETIAFPPDDLARARGENVDEEGLVLSGASKQRPYFAYGKVVKKLGGGVRFDWYPKCQIVENTDEIKDKGENFEEQNDTITIKAYAFDEAGNVKAYVDSEMANFPAGLTEDKFFEKPILTTQGLAEAVKGQTEESGTQENETQEKQEQGTEEIQGA